MSKLQIYSTQSASLNQGIKCLVYGPSGAGKTRLLASAPRPLIASGERGLLSLRSFNLPYANMESMEHLETLYNYMRSSDSRKFDTLCLDSISEIAELALADAKNKNKDARKAYGDMQEIVTKVVKAYRDLPQKHVVFIAKQETSKDGLTGAMFNMPSFPGQQLHQMAPYWFDGVFQLVNFPGETPGQTVRALRTQRDQYNEAKDRSGSLNVWENADPATGGGLTTIFNKMLASPAT